ncbi:two-component regulator propeller domain-containing protein [Spirosoma migulaei]
MRLLYLFILLPFALFAQPTHQTATGWQELTISDGLSQGMIFSIKQDQKGFIWAASRDGLNRYDGHNFTIFTHDPYNEFSLSGDYCTALLIDSHQRLWVGTLNQGLNLFDDRTQRFYHVDIRDQKASNTGSFEIQLLAEDPQGNIWVNTAQGKLFKISVPNSLKTSFPDRPNFTNQIKSQEITLPDMGVNAIAHHISFRADGQALVGTSYGMYSLNWRQPHKAAKTTLFSGEFGEFFSLYDDPTADFWAASTSNKIVCWQHGVQKTIPLPKKDNFSVRLKAIDANTIYIAATDFLWVMSPAELFQQDSLTARNAFLAVPPNLFAITDMLKDRTGNLWIGTSGYGLRKFNPRVKQFHAYLPNTSLTYLYQDRQGRLYARYQFAYGLLDKPANRLVPFLSNSLPPADQRQRFMMQDRQGFFWVSNVNFETHYQQLFKFSPTWQLLKKYPIPPNASYGFYGNQTLEDKTGNLWIGANNGKLMRFDPKTETFQVYSYQFLLPQSGAEIETSALYTDQAGTLWIGTQQGLIRADHPQTTPAFSIYKNSKTNQQSLSNNSVSSVISDPYQPAQYLWISTKGGGLERLDKQTGEFTHFTEAQGLPNKVVYGILVDEFKNLWMSTNRGLAQFNPRTFQFRNYTKADGLQDDEFNTGSFFKTPTGELLFGGVNGLTAFRASALKQKDARPPLVNIIGLKVNNEPIRVGAPDGILNESIEHTQVLDLSHNQNLVTLEFGVMDYTNSIKNRYRYRLEGVDEKWVEAGTNRFANYTHLPDGNFRFEMMGSADGELWSKPVVLQIRVHPPFYRTWWAYLLYLSTILFIGWQLYRFQTQRLLLQQQVDFEQKEASRLAELDTLKTQFFANISHEFRTPLTLILGPIEQAIQEYAHDQRFPLIQRNANRLLSLINQLLELSKLEAGQLKPELSPGDIAGFFRTLASSFSSLAESRQIQFRFTQNQSEQWAEFDRDKLEKITTNLLSNAFKFTVVGQSVEMRVKYPTPGNSGTMTLHITDTGIGIAPTHLAHIFERFYQVDGQLNRPYEGTGIGLALVKELVTILNGTIDATSTEGVGTTFTVTLPLVTITKPAPAFINAVEPSLTTEFVAATLGSVSSPTSLQPNQLDSSHENVMLIIDDNTDIRAYVRSVFQNDYQIIEAIDGQEGLDKATVALPNIVVCDLMMPRLDGFGFCRALKTQEATSHIPVVMLTAKATVEDRIEGFELGADEYLTKPFNQAEIQARVRNLIQQRERLYQYMALRNIDPALTLAAPTLFSTEHKFVERLTAIVNEQITNPDFSVEALAEAANLSRAQLHRKLKALTQTTATNFIQDIRLTKAAQLLSQTEQNVTQVAFAVGFENPSYFAKLFKERYGVLPSQFGKGSTPTRT